jgi:phosphomannomutase
MGALSLPHMATPNVLDQIVKAYDIRGTYPDQLDAELARSLGAAFARFVLDGPGADRVLVARDMRPSGPELVDAFSDGVLGQGLDVVDLGLASTDMIYFAAGHLDAPGAMFTASHNPARYNGIKLCLAGASPVGQDTGLDEIKRLATAPPPPVATRGSRTQLDLMDEFVAHVRSFVDVGAFRPLKVVADTANGMGGLVVPRVFDGLPFDLEVMYPELDGTFPNHPADPIQVENLADLRARVVEVGADIGLAFDGDADRVFLVDERGEPVSGSLTTALIAIGVLEKHPGAPIIHNLICSRTVPEVITEHGGTPVRSRVGHSFIKQLMAETGAAFGGEHSAHYYFRDNWRADSGLIASLVVLERLCRAGTTLSELLAPLDRYAASGEINTVVADPQVVIERIAAAYAHLPQDRLDGLTVDGGDWWFNLRPSNTEPLLRLNLEAPTRAECDARVAEVRALLTD